VCYSNYHNKALSKVLGPVGGVVQVQESKAGLYVGQVPRQSQGFGGNESEVVPAGECRYKGKEGLEIGGKQADNVHAAGST
jgi:hypothetical protein